MTQYIMKPWIIEPEETDTEFIVTSPNGLEMRYPKAVFLELFTEVPRHDERKPRKRKNEDTTGTHN